MHSAELKRRVLFLSTRNAARSVMAAAWLRQLGGHAYEVESDGTDPADVVEPTVIQLMQEVGVDISSERPRSSGGLHGPDYELVIVLSN